MQLVNAVDTRGNNLDTKNALKLLFNAVKGKDNNLDVVLMPSMSQKEGEFFLKNLKGGVTIACGRTSHKITRRYFRSTNDSVIVDVSDIEDDIEKLEGLEPIVQGLKLLTKIGRRKKKIIFNEFYNNMVSMLVEAKEANLKAQLFLTKLNGVFSKRIERVQFSAFNKIKIYTVQSQSYEKSQNSLGNILINETS